ncbi:extracellular solute-binding protein [Natrialba sp. INN-245]|uniref:extracellular solute-binding protein n=1 Tax=Natrialba sp. INN-245 TaxID=2690967 RepID=UPI001311B8AF|nr:extracellular solute-binding protein [Natrialba sp. INN-245]MWV38841.1 extracellular solute-binding protein [Natrialba sp. INN-245]
MRGGNNSLKIGQSRRKVLGTMGSIGGASLVAGCLGGNGNGNGGGDGLDSVELFTANLPFLDEMYTNILEDFEEEFGDQYDLGGTEWSDRGPEAEEIISYLESKTRDDDAPHVVQFYSRIFQNYNKEERVFADHEQFDGYDELTDRFFDGIIEDLRIDGEIRSIPYYITFPVIYSNNELFEEADLEPPSIDNRFTLDELLDTAVELYENSSAEFGFMFRQSGQEWYNMLYSEGVELLNDDQTEAALNTDRASEILMRLQDLTDEGIIPEVAWSGFADEPAQQFGAGTVGMSMQNVSSIRRIENFGEDWVTGETLTVGPVMENENYGSHLGRNPLGVWDLDRPQEVQQAAFDLCTVATRQEYMEEFLRETSVLVGHEEAVEAVRTDDEFLDQAPNVAEAYELFDSITGDTRQVIYNENIAEIWDILVSGIGDIGLGNVDPQEGLDDIEENINQILQR